MASTYLFANASELPIQNTSNGFGQIDANQFRVTSFFTGSNIMAYGVLNGKVMIVQNGSQSDTVNLILKPTERPTWLPAIKFFIYRGLLKSDFFVGSGDSQLADAATSNFLTDIYKGQNQSKIVETFNLIKTVSGSKTIEEIFENALYNFPLLSVKTSKSLGHFNGSGFGFEIILDEPGTTTLLSTVTTSQNIVDLTGLTGAAKFEKSYEILKYMDPAAYYASFGYKDKGSVGTNISEDTRKDDNVYDIVQKFATKNQVLLDIRDQFGLPICTTNNTVNFKLSLSDSTASGSTPTAYLNLNSWPLYLVDNSGFGTSGTIGGRNYLNLKISLPFSGVAPVYYLSFAAWKNSFPSVNDPAKFSTATIVTGYSSDAEISLQLASGTTNTPMSSLIKLQLFDIGSANAVDFSTQVPNTPVYQTSPIQLYNLLAPNLSNPIKIDQTVSLSVAPSIKLINYRGAVNALKTGTAVDDIGETCFAFRSLAKITPSNLPTSKMTNYKLPTLATTFNLDTVNGITNKETPGNVQSFFQTLAEKSTYQITPNLSRQGITYYKINFTDSSNSINCMEIRTVDLRVNRNEDLSQFEPLISLSYTDAQKTQLYNNFINNASLFSSYGPKFFSNQEPTVETHVTSPGNYRNFYKFTLKISGLQFNDSTNSFTWHNEDPGIPFYSINGTSFFTNDYSTQHPSRKNVLIWDNQVIPQVFSGLNPYDNSLNYQSSFKTTLYNNLNSIINTSDKNRLFLAEARDWFYEEDVHRLTFNISFRMPFFIEDSSRVPYTDITVSGITKPNNPYYLSFQTWFAYANTLRTLVLNPVLEQLSNTGQTVSVMQSIRSNPDSEALYTLLNTVKNASFERYRVPAYIGRLFSLENPNRGTKDNPRLSANTFIIPENPVSTNSDIFTSSQLQALVPDKISQQTKNDLAAGNISWAILNNPSEIIDEKNQVDHRGWDNESNGYYIAKKSDGKFYVYKVIFPKKPRYFKSLDKLISNYPANLSGLTIGFGYDIGQRPISTSEFTTFKTLNNFNNLTVFQASILTEGYTKIRSRAFDLLYSFKENVFDLLTVTYDGIILNTVNLIVKPRYLQPGAITISATVKGQRLLQVFIQDGTTYFFADNGEQFMNEIEKALFGGTNYNWSSNGVSPNKDAGKYMIHGINTHDPSFLIKSILAGSMTRKVTEITYLQSDKVKNFYASL